MKPVSPAGVAARCDRAGFVLSPEQASSLAAYLELLLHWNSRINLVGARSWGEALDDLILDSFHLAAFLSGLPLSARTDIQTWDLGSGAGLPGIPLRMIWPNGEYWLVEAREKRALFLSTVLARIPLPGTRVFRGRAETFMPGRKADLVISRAFMPWPRVLDLVKPHLAEGGTVILMTGEKVGRAGEWRVEKSLAYRSGENERHITAITA